MPRWHRVVSVSVLCAALGLVPASVRAAVLYDQTNSASGRIVSQDDSNNADDSQAADDFIVPAGKSWQISLVSVQGSEQGSPSTNVNLFLYATAGSVPGAELFRETNIPTINAPNFVIPVDGAPTLLPGTYWVSVQDSSGSDPSNDWYWSARTVQSGQPAVFRNPGHGFGSCTDWQPLSCEFTGPDLIFGLIGTAAPYTPPGSNQFTFGRVKLNKNKGTAELTVVVPGAGTLTLAGKGLMAQRPARARNQARAVGVAGKVKLLVKAKGKAKQKLNKTGKAKVKAKVTFTPTGGAPRTQTKKITLKKTGRT